MKRTMLRLFGVLFLFALSGCALLQTAPPAYKSANQYRLNAVEPWLRKFAAEHGEESQRVNDVLAAWKIEVDAQQHQGH